MNTHEAIKILRNTAWLGTNEDREKTEQAVEVISKALEKEPTVAHRETLEQVMWERDVAIEQLKELGYGFGEKIRTDEALQQEPSCRNTRQVDLISRKDVIDGLEYEKEMLNRVLDDMDVVGQEREMFAWGLGLVECFIEDIKELPSKEIINMKKEKAQMIRTEYSEEMSEIYERPLYNIEFETDDYDLYREVKTEIESIVNVQKGR